MWVVAAPAVAVLCVLLALMLADRADVQFDRKGWWWLLCGIPASAALFVYGLVRRRRALVRFASAELADLLTPSVSPGRQAAKAGLIVLGLLGIVAGVVGPKWGIDYERREATGIDVMIALDVSRSMLADDMRPSRLEVAKQRIERLIAQRENRVGLLAFAGESSLKCPLTLDYGFFLDVLATIDVSSAPKPGTDIALALRKAGEVFTDRKKDDSKVILIVTDGEDHGGYADEAAQELYKDRGIRTYTVGIGDSTRGRRIPLGDGGARTYLSHEGEQVWSKMNPTALMAIAQKGGGAYAPIEQFGALMDRLKQLDEKHLSMAEVKRYRPQYQWFLAAAMLLLTLEVLLTDRRGVTESGGYRRPWERGAQ